MDYEKDVLEEAVDFLLEFEDAIKGALIDDIDFDNIDSGYGDMRDALHTSVTDRSYTPEDAVYILQNCENEEEDSGIWEGLKDWRDELSARAAYTFSNDVWSKAEKLYNELKDNYKDKEGEAMDEAEEKDEEFDDLDKIADEVWNDFVEEYTVQPIKEGSKEEVELLKQWLALRKEAGIWGSYPLGGSYIDAREGSGHGMPEVKEFVDCDHEVAKKLPHMRHKSHLDVEKRLEELKHSGE